MKTMKYLSMMLFMVMASVCFSACGDDDEPETPIGNSSIVGTWEAEDLLLNQHEGTLRVVFNSNSKGTMTAIYDDGTDSDTYNFEYIIREKEGGNTTIELIWTGTQYMIYEEKIEYNISITPSRLSWGNITYTRK